MELRQVRSPADIQKLHIDELNDLCGQLRQAMVEAVSANGGHLASNLGAVELTVALHRVFTTPHDTIVWDVGHQCYAHKLLTGRYESFSTLRQKDGVSGFPSPAESEHDAFITGHSSTSISAANGIAKAKALTGDDGYTIAVIGDGALTGGLAYEGLSNAGRSEDRLIVILNDNNMSISRNVGFVSRHLNHLRSRVRYVRWKQGVRVFWTHVPLIGRHINRLLSEAKKFMKRSMLADISFFEDMGFYYMGPVDGHDLKDLHQALLAAKAVGRPVLLHVETVKGKGVPYAEKEPDIYHGISRFDPVSGQPAAGGESFSSHFGQALCRLAQEDERITAITAAMKSGTCLTDFARQFPTRFFDVGIAEEHAVTFASGMAAGGLLPVFAVYSPFLQRCYDQLINDTAIMGNHMVLAIDRSGIVPDDGETHQGIYDVAMLRTIPGATLYAPCNYKELELHLRQALYDSTGVAAVRYPKGAEPPELVSYEPVYAPYDHIDSHNREVLVVTYGRTFAAVSEAARRKQREGRPLSVLKLGRLLPLDDEVVALAASYHRVLFVEETGRRGGMREYFGSRLLEHGFTGRYAGRSIEEAPGVCTTAQGLEQAGLDLQNVLEFIEQEIAHE